MNRTRDTLRRFREYEKLGVRHIVQMGPDDRAIYPLGNGDIGAP